MFNWDLNPKNFQLKSLTSLLCCLAMLWSASSNSTGYLTKLNDPKGKIISFFNHQNGSVTLFIEGFELNPDQCADITKVHIKHDHAGFDSIVSTAMAAYISDKKVGVYSSGCEIIPFWGGTNTRPIVTELWSR